MQRKTVAEIDLAALRHNVQCLDDGKSTLIAVVKANAYGHGMLRIAEELVECGVKILAVAFIDEAQTLRNSGITQPILILEGPLARAEFDWMVTHNCWPMLHSKEQLDWISPHRVFDVPLWFKVDTGMHRLGFSADELMTFFAQPQYAKIKENMVLATHFACADNPEDPFSQQQIDAFRELHQNFGCPISISNSAGHIHELASGFGQSDYARVGITLYGCAPNNQAEVLSTRDLHPVMTLKAPIIAMREVAHSEGVGYGQTWTATRDSTIATVAIGYADGYPRHASNCGRVLVNGVTCPIVGRVSMDMITIDVTDVPCNIGDQVVLWGESNRVEHIASAMGTINYECVTRVSERVPRNYLNSYCIDKKK